MLACLGFAQLAGAASEPGPYMGAALGTFDYDEDEDVVLPLSDSTSAYQLFGGYKFTDHLADWHSRIGEGRVIMPLVDPILNELTGSLPTAAEAARVVIRLVAAVLAGAVIGLQRERAGKAAGFTHTHAGAWARRCS